MKDIEDIEDVNNFLFLLYLLLVYYNGEVISFSSLLYNTNQQPCFYKDSLMNRIFSKSNYNIYPYYMIVQQAEHTDYF